jgi:hypothetical protein
VFQFCWRAYCSDDPHLLLTDEKWENKLAWTQSHAGFEVCETTQRGPPQLVPNLMENCCSGAELIKEKEVL